MGPVVPQYPNANRVRDPHWPDPSTHCDKTVTPSIRQLWDSLGWVPVRGSGKGRKYRSARLQLTIHDGPASVMVYEPSPTQVSVHIAYPAGHKPYVWTLPHPRRGTAKPGIVLDEAIIGLVHTRCVLVRDHEKQNRWSVHEHHSETRGQFDLEA